MRRIFYYDNIKGLLILCVTLGHTLSICAKYYDFNYSTFKIISFFMMPLFVFITGKFAKKSRKSPLKRSLKMFKIYAIMQLLVTFYYTYIIKIIIPGKSLLIPRFTLWYLLTCALLYLSEYIFRKHNFKYVFLNSMILALGTGFFSFVTNFFSLTRTIATLPFFIIGYYSDQIDIIKLSNKYRNIILIAVFVITIWFLFNQDFFLFKDTYFKYSYYVYRNPLECFIKRILLYVLSFLFSAFILNVMTRKKTFLSNLGSNSLVIYLFHGVFLKTIYRFELFIDNKILGVIITYIIVILLSIVLGVFQKNIKKFGGMILDKFKIRNTKEQFQSI